MMSDIAAEFETRESCRGCQWYVSRAGVRDFLTYTEHVCYRECGAPSIREIGDDAPLACCDRFPETGKYAGCPL